MTIVLQSYRVGSNVKSHNNKQTTSFQRQNFIYPFIHPRALLSIFSIPSCLLFPPSPFLFLLLFLLSVVLGIKTRASQMPPTAELHPASDLVLYNSVNLVTGNDTKLNMSGPLPSKNFPASFEY